MVEVCVRGFFKVPLVRVTRGVWRKGVLEISRKHFKKTCKGIHILVNRSLFADNFMKMCSFVVIFQALHVHFKQFWSFYCTRIINYFCRCKFGLYFHRTPWPCMVCNNRTRLTWQWILVYGRRTQTMLLMAKPAQKSNSRAFYGTKKRFFKRSLFPLEAQNAPTIFDRSAEKITSLRNDNTTKWWVWTIRLIHKLAPVTTGWLIWKNYNRGVSNKNGKTKLHGKFLKDAYTMRPFLFEAMQSRWLSLVCAEISWSVLGGLKLSPSCGKILGTLA